MPKAAKERNKASAHHVLLKALCPVAKRIVAGTSPSLRGGMLPVHVRRSGPPPSRRIGGENSFICTQPTCGHPSHEKAFLVCR